MVRRIAHKYVWRKRMEENMDVGALQSAIAKAGAGWQAGPTTLTALPKDEQRARLGVPLPPPDQVKAILQQGAAMRGVMAAVGAPAAFDWRNVGGQNYVTPIKDQGGCGSCVAFGTCAAIETTFRRQRGNPNLAVDLSEAHLFYCHARSEGRNCGNGWWPDRALLHAQNTGITDDACYPYTSGDQNCSGLCADWQGRVTKITGSTALTNNPAGMKEWISTSGALTACFVVYNDFFGYTNGVYRHVSGGEAGGHCVSIVGYDDSQSCWICKNSWGAGWGDGGFFRIAYGECGIETWMVHGVQGIVETGWLNNTRVVGLWANDAERNAWAYLQDVGWRRIAFDNDTIFISMLSQLAAAKAASRPVNVYQDSSVIKQIYVF
jgi:C1A family cysteine protease